MGPLSTCLSQSLPEIRNPNSRFICFKGVTPSNTICCMETRSTDSIATDTMSIPLTQSHWYAFPPFCLIRRVLSKIQQDQVHTMTLITPCWQTQFWYPQVLGMLIRRPVLIPSSITLSADPKGNPHPLVLDKTLVLVIWPVSGRDYLSRKFLRKQPS